MTDNELKLIKLIRENDDQDVALVTAIETILLFLEQPQSFGVQDPAYPPGQA